MKIKRLLISLISGSGLTLLFLLLLAAGSMVLCNSASNGGGVYVFGSSATLNVSGGRISNNSASANGGGLDLPYSGVITAANDCIVNNSDTALVRSAGTLNASDNWWGAVDGPSGAGPGSGEMIPTTAMRLG